jgi:di/tricarboxylate transporter
MSGEENLQLQVLCVLLLCFLIMIKAVEVKEAYKAVNAGILLTIVGALALGDAVQDTGLAAYLASHIVHATRDLGQYGVLCGLYIAAAGLGLFVTNAAVVAILGEIGMRAAAQLNIPVATVALLITYASSACWMSPYSYQTNLMVMPVGNYTWGDFLKFGVPLQVLHMITCVLITPFCAQLIGCNGCPASQTSSTTMMTAA